MFFNGKKEAEKNLNEPAVVPGTREYEIKQLRYGKNPEKKKADLFIRAFMMINVACKNNLHGLSINSEKKDLEKNLKQLGVIGFERDDLLRAEWKDMANVYLNSCLTSHSYRSALSGMITLSDEKVARMIIDDIDTVLRKAPSKYGYEEDCSELLGIFRETYFEKVEDGQAVWDEYMETLLKK
ncbi:MAG: hypothetical protein K6F86_06580 [Lachnospiraceae bacterium]|nr:hypothetical protein [Lachnospiraceae bacterium]